jgi:hypothetical protein
VPVEGFEALEFCLNIDRRNFGVTANVVSTIAAHEKAGGVDIAVFPDGAYVILTRRWIEIFGTQCWSGSELAVVVRGQTRSLLWRWLLH